MLFGIFKGQETNWEFLKMQRLVIYFTDTFNNDADATILTFLLGTMPGLKYE
jgi:hypothetical protein